MADTPIDLTHYVQPLRAPRVREDLGLFLLGKFLEREYPTVAFYEQDVQFPPRVITAKRYTFRDWGETPPKRETVSSGRLCYGAGTVRLEYVIDNVLVTDVQFAEEGLREEDVIPRIEWHAFIAAIRDLHEGVVQTSPILQEITGFSETSYNERRS